MKGFEIIRLVVLTTLTVTVSTRVAYTDDRNEYPSSPTFVPSSLDQTRRDLLTSIINTATDKPVKKKLTEQLCPYTLIKSPAQDESARQALTVVENSMTTEVLFEKAVAEGSAEKKRFSIFIDFSSNRVLVRHNTPRFPSDAAGLSAPFPTDQNRGVWVEGKLGSDMFVLIPPVSECAVQAVLLCPRSYEAPNRLVDSQYKPVAARFIINAKSDGLYEPANGATGKVVASLQASSNIALPKGWSMTTVSAKDPAATVKFSVPTGDSSKYPAFHSMTLPWVAALRSRLDFGTETSVLRTAFKEITVEFSDFEMATLPEIRVGYSDFSVEGGHCTLVTQWAVSQL